MRPESPALLGAGRAVQHNNQRIRRYSDGGFSYCLRCRSVHSTTYGGPFPLVSPSSDKIEKAPEARGLQQIMREGEGRRRIAREVSMFLQSIAYIGFLMLLARSVEGCAC